MDQYVDKNKIKIICHHSNKKSTGGCCFPCYSYGKMAKWCKILRFFVIEKTVNWNFDYILNRDSHSIVEDIYQKKIMGHHSNG